MKNIYFEEVLKKRLIPCPKEIRFQDGECIIADGIQVELKTAEQDESFIESVEELFVEYWNATPDVRLGTSKAVHHFTEEQYELKITPGKITITSHCWSGIDYAMKTLRQLAEAGRGTAKTENYVVQPCVIKDQPSMDFRAIHICIFPETPMRFVEQQIRLAAMHKYNYAVIESWGTFPFKSHPEFAWKDQAKSASEYRALLDAADECGITLIPQFNIFGHASMSRVMSAKHAVLNFHREREPIYEPAGWSYCLSNQETRSILVDLVMELYEFFENPPYFHIGCDEAYDFQTCRECVKHDPVKLLSEHIGFFHDLFAQAGTRTIMWHDMLLDRQDSRWKDCIVCGNKRTCGLLDELPKDMIIADWQYDEAPKSNKAKEWPTSLYFRKKGFDTVVCPWMNVPGIGQIGAMVKKHGMFGMIETTWHTNFEHNFYTMYVHGAEAAWNGSLEHLADAAMACSANLRKVGYDMDIQSYEEAGHTARQIMQPMTQKS